MRNYLREIPPIHELQQHKDLIELQSIYSIGNEKLTYFIQSETNQVRQEILQNNWSPDDSNSLTIEIINRVQNRVRKWSTKRLKRVINATGTILHTNLGRARLSEEAITQVIEVAGNYSNLEYNIKQGHRGSRHDILEDLIQSITGAEAAMVVNNNAAAVYLVLRALANEKQVIVSRGELVEIGGSFRVSSIMEESGAFLREVGTTNKTHEYDYEHAINEETSMIMKVHTSNFKVVGFTSEVERKKLISLANQNEKVYYEDLGSGALYPFHEGGVGEEPLVHTVMEEGADLVTFSGDKLLGGPQAGIIAGKKELINKLKKHQLARVLRVDKMTLAALEATLKAYANGANDLETIPVIRDINKTQEHVLDDANRFIQQAGSFENFELTVSESTSQVGGGTMPEVKIPSGGITFKEKSVSAEIIEEHLRLYTPSVIGRFLDERLFLDFRTLTEEEQKELITILKEIDHVL